MRHLHASHRSAAIRGVLVVGLRKGNAGNARRGAGIDRGIVAKPSSVAAP